MDKMELLGKRIDAVSQLLKQPMSNWALEYWTGVHQQLVRKLNVENLKNNKQTR